jgi:excinuclease ABC subunit A
MEKPEVESIEGLSPSISIDKKTLSKNPRSTVGTVTEVYDFLRLLYARVGTPYCPKCGRKVSSQTPSQIFEKITQKNKGDKIKILTPIIKGRKGEYTKLFDRMRKKGFLRIRVDGDFYKLEDEIILEKTKQHQIELLIDEVSISEKSHKRIKEAVEKALEMSDGDLIVMDSNGDEILYSLSLLCPYCEISLPELEPRSFSFNSPYGACPFCHGIGYQTHTDSRGKLHVSEEVCPFCKGSRLKKESLAVKIGNKNIFELSSLPIDRLREEIKSFEFESERRLIADRIMKEIESRLHVISRLGMSYLHLARITSSLSGGEARRVRLAAQVGIQLRGVLYVLDEPTIGLHQKDNKRLISLLREIRDQGNSIVVVEHDEQTIRSADYILDLGPGAGEKGGEKVAEGNYDQIVSSYDSLTSKYLKREKFIPMPPKRREARKWLSIKKAAEHNLKSIDVHFPISAFTVVTGISGSGKSTLVYDILYKELSRIFHHSKLKPGSHGSITGFDDLNKVVSVDQKPIGRTPRSNPATYTGLFTELRKLFAMTPEARVRGYKPGRFSFNVPGGRCEECKGAGSKKIEMHFLPDVYVTCDRCGGKRYNKETLEVCYKGKNIADYLEMTVSEAYEYLKAHPKLKSKLGTLNRVGLGYLRLGQPAPHLSGGEAQRIKLTKELSRKNTGQTLYILDEPTTGLHFDDVNKLLNVLSELVSLGNAVIVIEHNLDVIKFADYIIDLGPEGGDKGGWLVACGSPEEVAEKKNSYTGWFLKGILQGKKRF